MTPAAPRFVRDRCALDRVLDTAKLSACPHCHRTGMLVGHGLLTGYLERGGDREVRGRRLLCSSRFRRSGCGRTLSVWIATVIPGFSVRTQTLAGLLDAVVDGMNRTAAWHRCEEAAGGAPGLSLRSGYRLWARLSAAQSRIRAALCALAPPPTITDARPIAQVLAHLRLVAGSSACSGCIVAAYQLVLQRALFG